MATKAKPQVELIQAYKLKLQTCFDYHNQWNAETKTFTPFSKLPKKTRSMLAVYEWLDGITIPVEAGVVPYEGWLRFIFGTEAVFFEFIEAYSGYDEEFRTHDRWYQALSCLADTGGEQVGFVHSDEICDQLIERARETGQIKG